VHLLQRDAHALRDPDEGHPAQRVAAVAALVAAGAPAGDEALAFEEVQCGHRHSTACGQLPDGQLHVTFPPARLTSTIVGVLAWGQFTTDRGGPVSLNPLRVAVIVASTREERFGPTVAAWFAGTAGARADLEIETVDLAGTDTVTKQLREADAFVVVTPEYNHSYPAPLKAVIDAHYHEWQAKPVAFVSYGGLSGGLRAVEHLRPVFAELHAVTVRDTVSFHGGRQCFGPDGQPLDRVEPRAAAGRLLDRLAWWGVTLREARAERPYATAV
jgi:NAD(P)H-dependent FMN reductase